MAGFTSCSQDEKLSNKTDIIEDVTGADAKGAIKDSAGNTYTPVDEISAEQAEREKAPKTRITYKEQKVDLGTHAEGTKVKHTFEFQNTGNEPLIIYSAQGSCGCTVPKYPKDPIAPGAKGKIDVEFDSNGRPGANTKTVTVNANTVPATTELTFTVSITPK